MQDIALLATGGVAGVLAGLLGVGGGLIMVPVLTYFYAAALGGVGQAMPYALGTSLAVIVFTGTVSAYTHHRHGAVDWRIVAALAPGLAVGTMCAALIVGRVSGDFLRWFFSAFVLAAAWQMWTNKRPSATRRHPTRSQSVLAGAVIGVVSGLVGIGGGTLTVPYLIWHGIVAQRAVAISAASGVVIALAGMAGYAAQGSGAPLIAYTTGYIIWPAVGMLAAGSMVMAPFGALLAHRLPAARLKRVFALVLSMIALRMFFN